MYNNKKGEKNMENNKYNSLQLHPLGEMEYD